MDPFHATDGSPVPMAESRLSGLLTPPNWHHQAVSARSGGRAGQPQTAPREKIVLCKLGYLLLRRGVKVHTYLLIDISILT
jgi:hypothetical protein